jgi:hypothetical protein
MPGIVANPATVSTDLLQSFVSQCCDLGHTADKAAFLGDRATALKKTSKAERENGWSSW